MKYTNLIPRQFHHNDHKVFPFKQGKLIGRLFVKMCYWWTRAKFTDVRPTFYQDSLKFLTFCCTNCPVSNSVIYSFILFPLGGFHIVCNTSKKSSVCNVIPTHTIGHRKLRLTIVLIYLILLYILFKNYPFTLWNLQLIQTMDIFPISFSFCTFGQVWEAVGYFE